MRIYVQSQWIHISHWIYVNLRGMVTTTAMGNPSFSPEAIPGLEFLNMWIVWIVLHRRASKHIRDVSSMMSFSGFYNTWRKIKSLNHLKGFLTSGCIKLLAFQELVLLDRLHAFLHWLHTHHCIKSHVFDFAHYLAYCHSCWHVSPQETKNTSPWNIMTFMTFMTTGTGKVSDHANRTDV